MPQADRSAETTKEGGQAVVYYGTVLSNGVGEKFCRRAGSTAIPAEAAAQAIGSIARITTTGFTVADVPASAGTSSPFEGEHFSHFVRV